ncbi:MAG: LLM class flavin-dependent oxidoreductase, partial [Myxococcales bacterium]|nr:LLM class flavin-dependent oxidoreductase [Myxococcales bacterium]
MAGDHLELGIFAPTIGRMPPVGPCSFQLVSEVPQRSAVDWETNRRIALLLERSGLEIFFQAQRGGSGFGPNRFWSHSLDSFSVAAAVAALTSRIRIMSTVHTAFYHPAMIARKAATLAQIAGPRWMLNLVSGWVKNDFDMLGIPFEDHAQRYRRTEEFATLLKKFWTENFFDYDGEFYTVRGGVCEPKPDPLPSLVNAGGSPAAKDLVVRHCDWYFIGSADPVQSRKEIAEVRERAEAAGRQVRFITYIFTLCRESELACQEELGEIRANQDGAAATQLLEEMSGQTIGTMALNFPEGVTEEQIIDGMVIGVGSAKHIGTPKQVAEQLAVLRAAGFDAVVTAFR